MLKIHPRDLDAVYGECLKCFENPGPGMNKYSEITSNLYITNWQSGSDIPKLKEMSVGLVILITEHAGIASTKNYAKRKIEAIEVVITENVQNAMNFEIYNVIQNYLHESRKVLIVCNDGCDKAPAFAALFYLFRYYDSNYLRDISITENILVSKNFIIPNIFKKIKLGRNCVSISPKYIQQLMIAEQNRKVMLNVNWQKVRKDYKITRPQISEEEKQINKEHAKSLSVGKEKPDTKGEKYDTYDDLF